MTRPSVAEPLPWRSERARSLRSKPSASIASETRAAVAGATPASALITRETVFRLTPAVCATSLIVGLDNVVSPRGGTLAERRGACQAARCGRCGGGVSRARRPSRHPGGELPHARWIELSRGRPLHAGRGGGDALARGGGERLAALERGPERGGQHVTRPDRVADLGHTRG